MTDFPGGGSFSSGFPISPMEAIRDSRLGDFLRSLEPERPAQLKRMRKYAGDNHIPVIREETEAFLRTMVSILRPGSILELGTAIGYSAVVMALACGDARITTVENYPVRVKEALRYIDEAGLTPRVSVIGDDITSVLRSFENGTKFDLIFLDAAKGQYLKWLKSILDLMRPGSVLIADNVLQSGMVAESRFAVPRRERSTHSRMREFLCELKSDASLETAILPVGDGVSLSVMLSKT